MSTVDDKIRAFETSVLLPSFGEVCSSDRLTQEYQADVIAERPATDAADEEVLAALAGALRRRAGPSLVLKNRTPPGGIAAVGGRYVITTFYEVAGDEVYASPGVMFWMRFNNKLHAFAHRYDNAIARHRVEAITRPHVLNHVLGSFDFYKLYAFSEEPFPGYR